MNEEQMKFIRDFLKEVHGMSETQIGKLFASSDSTKGAIEDARAKATETYDEGMNDAKRVVISSIQKELGIKVTEKQIKKLEEVGATLKPLLEEKYDASKATEADAVKEWKKKYEDALADRDKEVALVKTTANREVEELRRDSLAKEILKAEGYTIPEDSAFYQMKLDMVKSIIEKKGFNYEVDPKDGLSYRMKEEGVKERVGNKNVTFNDDFKQFADVAFGKTPADGKGTGMGQGLGTGGAGTSQAKFDWSKYAGKTPPPTNKDEARKQMNDPMLPLADRGTIRDYLSHLQAEEEKTTA